MSIKNFPSCITSYDLLKTFAVIIMVVDHMGFYFFPDDLWWRAVGRIGFPVWFFLVGYSRGRDLPLKLLVGAGILTVANLVVGLPIFPLNALVTIAIIRVMIDPVMSRALKGEKHLWVIAVICMFLTIPTNAITEYGTMALITAMFGYLVRHREEVGDEALILRFMFFALLLFIFLQLISFGFTTEQFMFVAIGTGLVRMVLLYFKSDTYPRITRWVSPVGVFFMQLCGRRTLEIYVLHLIVFKFAALAMGNEGFEFFRLMWMEF